MADGLGSMQWEGVAERESTVLRETVLSDGQRVVWKVLRRSADPITAARFAREYAVIRSVNHPNVVRTLTPEHTFRGAFAMPRLVGATLREWLHRNGPMPSVIATHVVIGLLEGLSTLHAVGVVHRDIKPSNVFYGHEAAELVSASRAILLDLGVAHSAGGPLTAEGMIIGTPRYLAPEQIEGGAIDARTDVYAAGLCLFELLTGAAFHDRSLRRTWELERRLSGLDLSQSENLTPHLKVLRTALRRDPAQRFRSARLMAQALVGSTQ